MEMSDYYRQFPAPVREYAAWFHAQPERGLEYTVSWRGVPAIKLPSDMWIYQELLSQLRPECIVEFGTKFGGSALFFADMLGTLNVKHGRVLTVDIDPVPYCALRQPRLQRAIGDSVSREVYEQVLSFISRSNGPVLFVEDSLHTYEHVRAELGMYCGLVTPGSYFVVEDGAMGDVLNAPLSGVATACYEFLRDHPSWCVDWSRNRLGHTSIHGGFLQRIS